MDILSFTRHTLLTLALVLTTDLGTRQVAANELVPVIEMRFLPAEVPLQKSVGTNFRAPELQIFQDGTVHVSAQDRMVSARMSPEHLQSLIHELVVVHQLGQYNSRQLMSEIQAEGSRLGLSSHIAGAEDTLIRIRTAEHQIDLRCHATGLLATRFPQVSSLQAMFAAQERLQNIRALVQLGDGRRAMELAARASESLQAQLPGASPITSRDLTMVHTLPDGTRFVQFCRRENSSPTSSQLIVISLVETPGEQPRVTVMPGDSVVR